MLRWTVGLVETDQNSFSAPKLAIFLVSVTVVSVKHGFGLLSVTVATATRFRREQKPRWLYNPIGY